jgi:hypothetical protein
MGAMSEAEPERCPECHMPLTMHHDPGCPQPCGRCAARAAEALPPGVVEVGDSDCTGQVRVRFALPQEWFTLPELRAFAAYLVTVADENEPSPEVDGLTKILEFASLIRPRAAARALLGAGYRLEKAR